MMLKGQEPSRIYLGNSFSDDGHEGQRFDYMLANPPFGVEWKKVKDAVDEEAKLGHAGRRFGAGLPRINDGSFLFLQHMLSKMQPVDKGGSRIAIVFNGSPLFTGAAEDLQLGHRTQHGGELLQRPPEPGLEDLPALQMSDSPLHRRPSPVERGVTGSTGRGQLPTRRLLVRCGDPGALIAFVADHPRPTRLVVRGPPGGDAGLEEGAAVMHRTRTRFPDLGHPTRQGRHHLHVLPTQTLLVRVQALGAVAFTDRDYQAVDQHRLALGLGGSARTTV
jgi:hypothetical protein